MKSLIFFFIGLYASNFTYGQTGVHIKNPQTTFHVDGSQDNRPGTNPNYTQVLNDFTVNATGSVGVGTFSPNISAILDINTKSGFLLSRVKLLSPTDNETINLPAIGLTVYHIGGNDMLPGIYTNVGSASIPKWKSRHVDNFPSAKLVYQGLTEQNKTVKSGLFEWKIVNTVVSGVNHALVQTRLLHQPATTVNLSGPSLAWFTGPTQFAPVQRNVSWTSTDWKNWKTVDSHKDRAQSIVYLECQAQLRLYRLSYYTIKDTYTALGIEIF